MSVCMYMWPHIIYIYESYDVIIHYTCTITPMWYMYHVCTPVPIICVYILVYYLLYTRCTCTTHLWNACIMHTEVNYWSGWSGRPTKKEKLFALSPYVLAPAIGMDKRYAGIPVIVFGVLSSSNIFRIILSAANDRENDGAVSIG